MEHQQIKKPSFIQRANVWRRAHKRWAFLIASIFVLMVAGGVAYGLSVVLQPAPEPTPQVVIVEPEPEPEPPKYYSTLTGELVSSQAITEQQVTAVMIENSPDARPQSGLKQSGVVFESIAEGGITRFLVLYQEDKPTLVGPVRSLRMANVDWLAAFDASVAHVGGSASALSEIRNGSYKDIDQFFNSGSYWRATDRYAPHNVYTNFERLDALNAAKGYTSSQFTAFPRADLEEADTLTATQIAVTMSSSLYNSAYTYNAESGVYARSQAGAPHLDREQGQITPKVVIVMKVPMQRVFEDGYREQITTIGSGEAYIFQNGSVQTVTWKKDARSTQLTFLDAAGEPVELARGQTWISAIPNTTGSVSWQ